MTNDVPDSESRKQNPLGKQLLFLAIAAVISASVVGYYVLYLRPREQARQREQAGLLKEAVEIKNKAVGHLENHEHLEAEKGFRRIGELVPDEPLASRDLAITYLVRMLDVDRVREEELFNRTADQAKQLLRDIKEAAPDDPTVFVLQGLFHTTLEERSEAIAAFLQAADLDENDPVAPYQAFELMQLSPEEYSTKERLAAIESAYARARNNLAIVIEYMKLLAADENEAFTTIAVVAGVLFKPLSARGDGSFSKYFERAVSAAKEQDWKTARTQLGFVGNLLRAEIAYTNDLNRLHPHPLEYVLTDFSPEFYEQHPSLRTSNPSPVNVEFKVEEIPRPADVSALELADLTMDGVKDLIVANEGELSVFSFPDPGEEPLFSIELPLSTTGIAAADLDRDYQLSRDESLTRGFEGTLDTDLDLILWGPKGLVLLQNDCELDKKQLKLSLVPFPPGSEKLTDVRDVAVADLDHDGDLDFAAVSAQGVTLWSNNGNWTFADFTPFSHLPEADVSAEGLLAADVDRNVLNDFLVATGSGLYLLENDLHGRYLSRPVESADGAFTNVTILDVNRDASWDLLTAGPQGLQLIVGQTLHKGGWKPRETKSVSKTAADGVEVWDYNNDGFDDAVAWNDSGIEIFAGGPDNALTLQSKLSASLPGCEQLRVADVDGDGDQDLVILTGGQLKQIVNEGGNSNHWIDIRLRAEEFAQTPRQRCNMHGVGDLLELKTDGVYQSRIVRGPLTHFGIGRQEQADVMRVVWTNGIPHNILNPKHDDVILEQQYLLGSCPYLYTWDGEKFVFATDCLWAAPIGLQFAQGILAPCREWEYLKISGDILKPKEDEYVLQMTEELWEAAYYDSVKLMAVDHPAEVDVFTNEKVGPAEIAEFKVHTVTHPREPVSIVDQQGRDVSGQTRQADGIYTKTWERRFTQGLTETHWLEIDLGELDNPSQIKLFLTGWVFPTDSSLNIAISQNLEKPRPKPPALHVPDENGTWREVSPYVGFPGGKTKTIVLDLSDQFLTDDYRLRLVTNMEIRWEHVFFTVDEPQAEYDITDLELKDADLHYRGFSARIPRFHNQHENYDYNRVNKQPLWPPMGGHFTRYGEVTELIQDADDLQAVLGAGDEMTVRFAVPEKKLPEGWVRDFILYNIGWDKDAGLNTVQGQQVEPLPFRAMKAYPYAPDQSFPDTPRHREYLKTYQTRFQSRPEFQTQIRDWKPGRN